MFFETFERTGSAWATVQAFRRQALEPPERTGRIGEIAWQELSHTIALDTLHNPRYAGVFCFGRTRSWKDPEGKHHCQVVPREQWRFLKREAGPGSSPGISSWPTRNAYSKTVRPMGVANARPGRRARDRPACGLGPVRQVRAIHDRLFVAAGASITPDYLCQKNCVERSQPACQRIPGSGIDEALGRLLVESVSASGAGCGPGRRNKGIQARLLEADRLRQQQVQRAQYEADRARLRYVRVDPE